MTMRFFQVTLTRDGIEREVIVPSKTDVQAGDAAASLAKPGEAISRIVEVEDDGLQHADGPPSGTQTHPTGPPDRSARNPTASMTDRLPPPAIVQLASDRPDLLIFEVRARITRDDIERMAESVQGAIDAMVEVDILLIFVVFEGATLGAIFDAEATKASLKSTTHVRRYGVVGAPLVARAMINLFDTISPVDAETFDLEDLPAARAWIDGSIKPSER